MGKTLSGRDSFREAPLKSGHRSRSWAFGYPEAIHVSEKSASRTF
jgi:hypothetical protein